MKSQTFTISIVVLLMIAGFIAMDVYLPSFPAIAQVMHTSVALTQLTLSAFLFSFGIAQFLFGILSDKHGRKPMILIGAIIYVLGSWLAVTAKTIETLILARLIQGIGAGATVSVARVVLRDLFHGNQLARVMSFIAMIIAITPAVAPVIGGTLQEQFGFRANFILMLGYGVLALLLVIFFLPETNPQKNHHATKIKTLITNGKILFSSRIFVSNIFANALGFSVIITYSTINPFLLQQTLGYSAQNYGWITLLIVSGLIIGMFANGKLTSRYAAEKLIRNGWWLVIYASALITLAAIFEYTNIYFIVGPLLIVVFGAALVLPNAAANIFAPFPKIAGTVGAVYGSMQVLIAAIVGAVLSWLHAQTQLELGLMIGALGFLGLGVMQAARTNHQVIADVTT